MKPNEIQFLEDVFNRLLNGEKVGSEDIYQCLAYLEATKYSRMKKFSENQMNKFSVYHGDNDED